MAVYREMIILIVRNLIKLYINDVNREIFQVLNTRRNFLNIFVVYSTICLVLIELYMPLFLLEYIL